MKKYPGTVNATEALSKCWLSGRKIHIATLDKEVLDRFGKFCLISCRSLSIVNLPITLHAVPLHSLLIFVLYLLIQSTLRHIYPGLVL